MLAFVHIPKTAGTTLHKVISHQYHRGKIFIRHDTEGLIQGLLAVTADRETSLRMGSHGQDTCCQL